jgi:hypothetical protein
MSFTLMQAVVDTTGISLAPKAVLLVLARHARDDGTNEKCPSVQTLADKAGMSAKGARNALRSLEADGWIVALSKKSGGRCQTTHYRIAVGMLGPRETRHEAPPIETDTRHHVPPNGHDTRHHVPPNCSERRNDVPLKAAPRSAEEVSEEVEEGGGGSAGAREVAIVVGGLSGVPATGSNVAAVKEWLADGYDPQLDIYPAVVEALPTAPGAIGSFRYFTKAIGRHHAARTAPQPEKVSGNVHHLRPASGGERRQPPGRAGWRDQSLAYIADLAEEGD